jgi:hypothetical protein
MSGVKMKINEKEARLIFQMGQENYDNGLLNQEMLEFIQKISANMCHVDVSKWDYIFSADKIKIIESKDR